MKEVKSRRYAWFAVLAMLVSILNAQCVFACSLAPTHPARVAVSLRDAHACCHNKHNPAPAKRKDTSGPCQHSPSLVKGTGVEADLSSVVGGLALDLPLQWQTAVLSEASPNLGHDTLPGPPWSGSSRIQVLRV